MHPAPAFAWTDEAAMRAFVAEAGFAQLCAVADGAPIVAHAPLWWAADGSVRFHLAGANRIVPHIAGRPLLACVMGEHFYVSPDWYGTPDQVPTWNYRAVEIEGVARPLEADELAEQVDRLGDGFERALLPKPMWTSDKLSAQRRATSLGGIVGFAIEAPRLRGTAKFGQTKSSSECAGVAAALRAMGRAGAAAEMEGAR